MKKSFTFLFAVASVCILCCCSSAVAAAETGTLSDIDIDTTTGNGDTIAITDESSAVEIVKDMGIGINLGNTFESCGTWITGKTVTDYETAWGSCVITEDIIKGYASAGFRCVRIPVAWSNLMSTDGTYTIDANLMARVTQIVKWVTGNNMYAVVNIHWDGGWWTNFPTEYDSCMAKYRAIWTQISSNFRDFDNRLILESLNEEGVWDTVWNHYGSSTTGKKEAYGLLNDINQTFTTLVRSSGGKNATRLLLIAGYGTGFTLTCDPLFEMPSDTASKCAVSVHYYTPSTFAILTEDASWGKTQSTWGSASEKAELMRNFQEVKTAFVDRGIPVIVGEYGCPKKNKETASVRLFLSSVCETAYGYGMCPVLWDTYDKTNPTGNHYNRSTCTMTDDVLRTLLRKTAKETR